MLPPTGSVCGASGEVRYRLAKPVMLNTGDSTISPPAVMRATKAPEAMMDSAGLELVRLLRAEAGTAKVPAERVTALVTGKTSLVTRLRISMLIAVEPTRLAYVQDTVGGTAVVNAPCADGAVKAILGRGATKLKMRDMARRLGYSPTLAKT